MTDADLRQVRALLQSLGLVDANGKVRIPSVMATTAATATAGVSGAAPAQVAGYEVVTINGVQYKRPYYLP